MRGSGAEGRVWQHLRCLNPKSKTLNTPSLQSPIAPLPPLPFLHARARTHTHIHMHMHTHMHMHMHIRAHSIALCLAHSVSRTQHVIARAWSPCKAREHRASTHAHTHTSNALRSTQDRGLGLWFKSARILAVRCVPPSRRLFDLVRHPC